MTNVTPANEFVTDTVGLVLRLENRRMGATAKTIFESAEAGRVGIYVPAMVLAEILYLSEKHRINISLKDVDDYFQKYPKCREYPLNFSVIKSAAQITDVSELHDRLIAATARALNLELITDDASIQDSAFAKTIW